MNSKVSLFCMMFFSLFSTPQGYKAILDLLPKESEIYKLNQERELFDYVRTTSRRRILNNLARFISMYPKEIPDNVKPVHLCITKQDIDNYKIAEKSRNSKDVIRSMVLELVGADNLEREYTHCMKLAETKAN